MGYLSIGAKSKRMEPTSSNSHNILVSKVRMKSGMLFEIHILSESQLTTVTRSENVEVRHRRLLDLPAPRSSLCKYCYF
jgi:hypothetical protein